MLQSISDLIFGMWLTCAYESHYFRIGTNGQKIIEVGHRELA